MAVVDKIKDEKLKYNINKETERILSLSKNAKYEYLTSEEILPSD